MSFAPDRQGTCSRNGGDAWMGARFRLIGTLATGLLAASNCVQAQDTSKVQVLPDVEVSAPPPSASRAKPTRSAGTPRVARVLRRVPVYPTAPTPTASTGIEVDKVPSAINAAGANQIGRTDSLNIADTLQ